MHLQYTKVKTFSRNSAGPKQDSARRYHHPTTIKARYSRKIIKLGFMSLPYWFLTESSQKAKLLRNSWTSAVELYCGNSQRVKTVGYIRRRSPWCMFSRILNATLMLGDIFRTVWQHSPECFMTFPRIFDDIPRNIWRHSPECLATYPGMFGNIPRKV